MKATHENLLVELVIKIIYMKHNLKTRIVALKLSID